MELNAGTHVLDLGCGNGWAARWMLSQSIAAKPPVQVTGVDLAKNMIAKARRHGDARLQFIRASFSKLPFSNAKFEEIFSMEALYYATDFDAALREIARVLKPKGRLYVATDYYAENPHCHSWPQELDVKMTLLSAEEWVRHLEENGFAVSERFRCLDPRAVETTGQSESERRAIEDFRQRVGSLALVAQKKA